MQNPAPPTAGGGGGTAGRRRSRESGTLWPSAGEKLVPVVGGIRIHQQTKSQSTERRSCGSSKKLSDAIKTTLSQVGDKRKRRLTLVDLWALR